MPCRAFVPCWRPRHREGRPTSSTTIVLAMHVGAHSGHPVRMLAHPAANPSCAKHGTTRPRPGLHSTAGAHHRAHRPKGKGQKSMREVAVEQVAEYAWLRMPISPGSLRDRSAPVEG